MALHAKIQLVKRQVSNPADSPEQRRHHMGKRNADKLLCEHVTDQLLQSYNNILLKIYIAHMNISHD